FAIKVLYIVNQNTPISVWLNIEYIRSFVNFYGMESHYENVKPKSNQHQAKAMEI
ncbi:38596_t:CDS:1, partial [Gigaspora margarita]